ncbi:hypothetical protein N665_0570s0001 [Sinapis alba]|nr:hypothetical protein N665_0570s0001 [Sinapis alba]
MRKTLAGKETIHHTKVTMQSPTATNTPTKDGSEIAAAQNQRKAPCPARSNSGNNTAMEFKRNTHSTGKC